MSEKLIYFNKEARDLSTTMKNIVYCIESPTHPTPEIVQVNLKSEFLETKNDLQDMDSYLKLHKTCSEKDIRLSVIFDTFSAQNTTEVEDILYFTIDKDRPYAGSTHQNCFL